MKLYRKTTKRIAKKHLGRYTWNKLNKGRFLKPGDLVSTCIGYNQVIEEITPEYSCWKPAGKIVHDFHIITTDGSSHSFTHCCEGDLETKEQIEKY